MNIICGTLSPVLLYVQVLGKCSLLKRNMAIGFSIVVPVYIEGFGLDDFYKSLINVLYKLKKPSTKYFFVTSVAVINNPIFFIQFARLRVNEQ